MKNNKFNDYKNKLINKLDNNDATISIIGLGYVGLPLALAFANKGFRVLGVDIDKKKVDALNNCQSYIQHIDNNLLEKVIKNNTLTAHKDFEILKNSDAIIICVPTPLNTYREPDLSFIKGTMDAIFPHIKAGQIISLESTTYPGTTEEELKPNIEKKKLTIGEDFFLIYSPEREDPGNINYNTSTIPKVIGGSTNNCCDVGIYLYNKIIEEIVPVSNTKTAELTKLLENIHRAVNIGLMNELKPLADRMGIDLYEVIRAAATKPFGFVPYYPGPGLGGHCIPIDPFYLTWKAREYGMNTKFIELAGEINASMPQYVVNKLIDGLNNIGKPIKKSKILILGISYKKNVDDVRESPSVKVMNILFDRGAIIEYSDPFFPEFPKMRKHTFNLKSIKLNKKNIKDFDAVILATDHDAFDYELIEKFSNLIIDTRGKYLPSNKIISS